MSKLTQYWRRKKRALEDFLAPALSIKDPVGDSTMPPGGYKKVVQDWFDRMTKSPGAGKNSLEEDLEKELDDLATAWAGVSSDQSDSDRKSARLVSMVQGAARAENVDSGFYASVADVNGVAATYKTAVKNASKAAARFLQAAKNHGTGSAALIAKSLGKLADANPTVDSLLLEEIRNLQAAIETTVAKGGAGEGSAYWPSSWVSSSSGG